MLARHSIRIWFLRAPELPYCSFINTFPWISESFSYSFCLQSLTCRRLLKSFRVWQSSEKLFSGLVPCLVQEYVSKADGCIFSFVHPIKTNEVLRWQAHHLRRKIWRGALHWRSCMKKWLDTLCTQERYWNIRCVNIAGMPFFLLSRRSAMKTIARFGKGPCAGEDDDVRMCICSIWFDCLS